MAAQRFEISTFAFLTQCCYRLSYRAVLMWLLLSDYFFSPNSPNFIKIGGVVHEKQLSGSPIQISIRITPNFEFDLPLIITSVLTKFHQNPTSSLWEILLTYKQTNKQTNKQINRKFWPHRVSNSRPSRFQHNALTDWAIGSYSSDYYYQVTIIVPTHQISSKFDQ